MNTTRWIAAYDETRLRLEIFNSNSSVPMYTWRNRQDLTQAIQTLILWSWSHPANGWQADPVWERLGESSVLVAETWPVRVTVEDR